MSEPVLKPATGRSRRAPRTAAGVNIDDVLARLRAGQPVRRALQPWGRLHIDRALPFLVVYRRPAGQSDMQSEALVTTQASYLLASGDPAAAREVGTLTGAIVRALSDDFGACLLIELSIARHDRDPSAHDEHFFRIVTRPDGEPSGTIAELEAAITLTIKAEGTKEVGIEVARRAVPTAIGLPPLLDSRARGRNAFSLGLELSPVYADQKRTRKYPVVHRQLRKDLSSVLKRTAFVFTRRHTTQRPRHYHALGRARFVNAVWNADRDLADVGNRFDFLLLSTPRNAEEAWLEFRRSRFARAPRFSYPPLPFEPALAKRDLYRIPLERIEDPTIEDLFREQQDEIDRKITMLGDRGTPRFLYASLQLFGAVNDDLLAQALAILDALPPRSREPGTGRALDARAFAARAEEELRYLRRGGHALPAQVRIRDDVSGLMVSRGHLLVPSDAAIPAGRVDALLQHEVGTHIVTYYNGAAQPLQQLRSGLPGYDELQEGLAVLAEYLVGGLSRARLRVLAARVLAVRRMADGASFVDVFRELDRVYDFAQRTAYLITMRVFRGGGQVKDAVYLRGLVALLAHLSRGGQVEPLLTGKISLRHLDVIDDLRARDVLVAPPFRPRYLDQPDAVTRLARVRGGARPLDLTDANWRTQP